MTEDNEERRPLNLDELHPSDIPDLRSELVDLLSLYEEPTADSDITSTCGQLRMKYDNLWNAGGWIASSSDSPVSALRSMCSVINDPWHAEITSLLKLAILVLRQWEDNSEREDTP